LAILTHMKPSAPLPDTVLIAHSRRGRAFASVVFALAAWAAAFTGLYGALASWPITAMGALVFAAGVCTAVGSEAARSSGLGWPHAAAGAALAATAFALLALAASLSRAIG